MQDALRRALLLGLILILTGVVFHVLRSRSAGYGLIDFLAGRSRPAAAGGNANAVGFTPAPDAPVKASEVELLTRMNRELASLVGAVRPAVVSIQAIVQDAPTEEGVNRPVVGPAYGFRRGLGNGRDAASVGSGVIVSREGHVVTNYHVVDGYERILIQTSDGKVHEGRFVNSSVGNDMAVLQIVHDGRGVFPALPFGDSDEVRAGEMVFAFGNPYGFGESVTQGIINALPRPISDSGFEMFQTDTVISPGYSGGPLVNLHGEVIGINVARYVYNENPDQWQGLGFAIPSNDVRRVFEAMMRTGRDLVGYLGVQLQYVDGLRASGAGQSLERAIEIVSVTPGSPAEKAGLRAGDLVRTFAGTPVESQAALIRRIQSAPVGQPVKVQIERDGNLLEIAPEIGEYSEYFTAQAQPGEPSDVEKVLAERTGLELTLLNVYQRRRAGLHEAAPGVLVKGVRRDNESEKLQPSEVRDVLLEGDIILDVSGEPIFSPQQLYAILVAQEPGSHFALRIFRRGWMFDIAVTVPERDAKPPNEGEDPPA